MKIKVIDKIISIFMALVMALGILASSLTTVSAAENDSKSSVDVTIKAKVEFKGGNLENEQFEFQLIGKDGQVLKTAKNKQDGTIIFDKVKVSTVGKQEYKVKQIIPKNKKTNITYDENEYTVTVSVREQDLKEIKENTQYYGIEPSNEYISMSEVKGQKDFSVFCIDLQKTAPGTTPTSKTYKVLKNPTNEVLKQYVTKNIYGDQLSNNLKKIFFYFQAFPNKYKVREQKDIVWQATGSDYQGMYNEDLKEIFKTELPKDYNLVLFVPEENPDRIQTVAMGYGATISHKKSQGGGETTEEPVFINKVIEEAAKTKVQFSKKDIDKSGELQGAKLKLVKGKENSKEEVTTWDSGEVKVLELENGEYTLIEVITPKGYKTAAPITFKVENNEVSVDNIYVGYTNLNQYDLALDNLNNPIYITSDKENYKGLVAYCYNAKKKFPTNYESIKKVEYKKRVGTAELFKSKATNSILGEKELKDAILRIANIGYPNNKTNIQGRYNLTEGQFRNLTQKAIWYYTDNIKEIGRTNQGMDYPVNQQNAFKELIQNDTEVPQNLELNLYDPVDTTLEWQNLLGTYFSKPMTITMFDERVTHSEKEKEITFSKVELNGTKELIGADLKVVQGENEDGKVVQQWTSQKEAKKIKLAEGIYTMVEIQAPAGYEIAESITFRITYEGKLEIKEKDKWLEKGDAPIVMVDRYADQTFKFAKRDVTGAELKGATIELRKAVDNSVVSTWKSDGTVKEFKVQPGSYKLVETAAPEGYAIATEINFTIDKAGKVKVDGIELKGDAPIVMVDDYLSKSGIPESSNIPNTGDSSIITGYLELMALSLTALLLICKRKRKLEI